jgi:hypothetical protein
MKIPSEIMHFRNKRAQDLRLFADKLDSYVGNGISRYLYDCVRQLQNDKLLPAFRNAQGEIINNDVNYWGYSVTDIELEIKAVRHLKPIGVNKATAYIDINLVSDFRNWEDMKDPFCELNMRVVIKGFKPQTEEKNHFFGFHIDRHHESQDSDEIHPTYHLQYILNPKNNPEFDYGSTLNIDSPRFLHLPMDLILGLTYLIANFQPENYRRLMDDPSVARILKNYQNWIWKPYSHTISSHWNSNGLAIQWDKNTICPFLL